MLDILADNATTLRPDNREGIAEAVKAVTIPFYPTPFQLWPNLPSCHLILNR